MGWVTRLVALVTVPDLGFNHHRCKQHELDDLRLTSALRVGIVSDRTIRAYPDK